MLDLLNSIGRGSPSRAIVAVVSCVLVPLATACSGGMDDSVHGTGPTPSPLDSLHQVLAAPAMNPDDAPVVAIDRFSDTAAHLFKRSEHPAFPGANVPVDFDKGPFITYGFGPTGEHVAYYNFDAMLTQPAPIYAFFKAGGTKPVDGQINIVDVLPGDAGYNDFWNVVKVVVPDTYVANTVTSAAEIKANRFPLEPTKILVNCPLVPDGSTAKLRYTTAESAGLQRGWYRGKVVKYFTFGEHALAAEANGSVPLSDIYVSFNKNPDAKDATSGPASGFMMEAGSEQVHNVVATIPQDAQYSPLWDVNVYDHRAFASVKDLGSALRAPSLAMSVAQVNCPVVAISPAK